MRRTKAFNKVIITPARRDDFAGAEFRHMNFKADTGVIVKASALTKGFKVVRL